LSRKGRRKGRATEEFQRVSRKKERERDFRNAYHLTGRRERVGKKEKIRPFMPRRLGKKEGEATNCIPFFLQRRKEGGRLGTKGKECLT